MIYDPIMAAVGTTNPMRRPSELRAPEKEVMIRTEPNLPRDWKSPGSVPAHRRERSRKGDKRSGTQVRDIPIDIHSVDLEAKRKAGRTTSITPLPLFAAS